jgi:hypothetical protein
VLLLISGTLVFRPKIKALQDQRTFWTLMLLAAATDIANHSSCGHGSVPGNIVYVSAWQFAVLPRWIPLGPDACVRSDDVGDITISPDGHEKIKALEFGVNPVRGTTVPDANVLAAPDH